MINKLRGALRSVTVWVNGLILAALPFADAGLIALADSLPSLRPHLPDNIYMSMGFAVAIFNIYQRAKTTMSLAEKGSK